MKVLITRAEPAASQTAKSLSAHGHEAIVMPLFEVIDTGASIPQKNYDGIVFTSRNAVEILQMRGWQHKPMDILACCVGQKTQQAAKAIGFSNTLTANGGGKVLCEKISGLDLRNKHFLYLSTPDKSLNISDELEPLGIKVDTIDIYQAKTITPKPEEISSLMKKIAKNCIFSYSALSSEHLADLFLKQDPELIKTVTLIGISNQAIKPLTKFSWKSILIPKKPNEASMMKLIP